MLKLSTFIFCIIYHFGQKNIVSVVIFSLGNLYRTGWSVFCASEIGFECEFCIKRNACQSFCFCKSLSANCNIMLLNARDKNGFFHHQWKILYSFTGIFHFSFLPSFWAILHHVTVGSLRGRSWIRVAWNLSDCFKSFSPLNNVVTEGVITTRSSRMRTKTKTG